MKPIDSDTKKSRGFTLLSFHHNNTNEKQNNESILAQQPVSILFISKMSQNKSRLEYKTFLDSQQQELKWKQVLNYWTKDGTSVWDIVEPVSSKTEQTSINEVRLLLQELLRMTEQQQQDNTDCACTGCITALEAIYIVYLASLDVQVRTNTVINFTNSNASKETRERLLVEAGLVSAAIEISQETTL